MNKPSVIIGKTNKGAGISGMIGSNEWHHAKLTKDDYNTFINDLS